MRGIPETIKVLIICNVLFFAGTLISGDIVFRLFALFYFENPNFQVWQPVSHMFMHGGYMHIIFNMYALWAFGSPLEMQWGRNKFLFFYFSAGLGAAFIHNLVAYIEVHSVMEQLAAIGWNPQQIQHLFETGNYNTAVLEKIPLETLKGGYDAFNTPAVGASGAIYGVLVAFGMLYPNVALMLIFFPVPIKAKYFIPALILLDLFSGLTGVSIFGQNIANWAHIGGALFGFIMAYYWKKNSFDNTRWY